MQLNLYINTATGQLLASPSGNATINATSLPLFYGDTITLRIYLMTPTGNPINVPPPFTSINNASYTLNLYIDDGTESGTVYASQLVFNNLNDSTGFYFQANLALNTAALLALIGSSVGPVTAYLKIGYFLGGLQTTVFSGQVNIGVGIPTTAVAPAPPGQVTLTVAQALQMFFPNLPVNGTNNGQPIYLMSANGHIMSLTAVDNADGTVSLVPAQVS